ncbi:MAG: prepilin-type N-terminal cleavage/methylation domain-containing protein, partial [Rhodobacterales bacterium]|nr:prepilin-type N-terminal cleavage/methylation domain-containing protein [Rhodobacterales bacterium]
TMTPRSRTSAQGGFTLLEVLVALTLLGVIMAVLFGGLRFGARAWVGGEERVETATEFRAAYRVLRDLAGGSVPATWSRQGDPPAYLFRGAADRLVLATAHPLAAGRPGLHRYAFRVERRDGGPVLVLYQAPVNAEDAEDAPDADARPEDGTVLIGPAADMAFAYFGAERPDTPGEWSDDWPHENNLPRLVRLTVTGRDGRDWPPLVLPLHTDMDLGCAVNLNVPVKCRLDEGSAQ